jgi:hypothetical protein
VRACVRKSVEWLVGIGIDLLGLVVFKLDVKAVFDADLHLDCVVGIWGHAVGVYPDVALLDDVGEPPGYGDADVVSVCDQACMSGDELDGGKEGMTRLAANVPELYVDAVIALVLLFDVFELKVKVLCCAHLAGRGELLYEREKLVVVTAIVEHLCRWGKGGERASVIGHAGVKATNACIPMLPTNSILIPSCTSFLPSRTRTDTWSESKIVRPIERGEESEWQWIRTEPFTLSPSK